MTSPSPAVQKAALCCAIHILLSLAVSVQSGRLPLLTGGDAYSARKITRNFAPSLSLSTRFSSLESLRRSKRHAAETALQDKLSRTRAHHRRRAVLVDMLDLVDASGESCKCLLERKPHSCHSRCPLVSRMSSLLQFFNSSPDQQAKSGASLASLLNNMNHKDRAVMRGIVMQELRRLRMRIVLRRNKILRNWRRRHHSVFDNKQLISY